ncbi:MAG: low molecular weight phosphotyrosine protein phosphatase [Bacteroidetes bacterium]|nr:low molecular weight phosphotyrosine protein phosphatase [Bacteroidota bacterium]
MKILMVCLGNICRSPLAEGILRKHLESLNLPHSIDSAGTINFHSGSAPDPRAIEVAADNGIDISGLSARQVNKMDFEKFDFIFAMDRNNYKDLTSLSTREQQKRIYLFLDFAGLGQKDVPDPYYGNKKQFEEVFELLDHASLQVSAKLLKNNSL